MKLLQTYQLFRLIRHNQKLAMKRHPMFETNKWMKGFTYVFIALWAAYLMIFGVMLGMGIDGEAYEAFDLINGGMIFLLALDFFQRFSMQETPAQQVKPFRLLPVRQVFLLNVFLARIGLNPLNLFWGFFLVPFGLLSVVPFFGLLGWAGFLFGWWLMFVANSYWYLVWRTAMLKHTAWVAVPILIYAALITFGIVLPEGQSWLFRACLELGRSYLEWDVWGFALCAVAVVVLFLVSRWQQQRHVYDEIAKVEQVGKVRSFRMGWLDRFGIIGEYIKLELKSTQRNKVVRRQFISGCIFMLIFCTAQAFTEVYDHPIMHTFICVYCYTCIASMTLTSIMCVEGNYMDFLMSHKESILQLLKAKYYFHSLLLVVPFLFSLLPIFQGKLLLVESVGCAFFTIGAIFPFLFQLAVYNKTTLPLNQTVTKQGGNTKIQMLFSLMALFVPMLVMSVLVSVFDTSTGAAIMLVIGFILLCLHPLWLRNIYNRLMIRRYENMQGFRDSLEEV